MGQKDSLKMIKVRGSFYCRKCGQKKLISEKCTRCRSIHCIPCDKEIQDEYKQTEEGFINTLLKSCRQSAKRRLKKGRKDAGVCTLTFAQVKNKLKSQNYKCYYSGLPMM